MLPRTLIVGIGSHHGDDRFGWLVAEQLTSELVQHDPVGRAEVRLARSPSDLLDWLEGIERLIVCDACHDVMAIGQLWRWNWPSEQLEQTDFSGTHDLQLPAVLRLAYALKCLPSNVVVWSAIGKRFEPNQSPAAEIVAAAAEAARRIRGEFHGY